MTNRAVTLDYVPRRRHLTLAGVTLATLGACAAGAMLAEVSALASRRDALRMQAEAANRAAAPRKGAADDRAARELAGLRRELDVPWSRLLGELEAARHESGDAVAVLGVEPDADGRRLHVTIETRTLPEALRFVQRLQRYPDLRFPAFESHETRVRDAEHPVRVKIVAGWRL